jgi:hypothetical protein
MDLADRFLTFMIGVLVGVLLLMGLETATERTYKDGQVKALTGKVEYKLVVNADSTRTWEYIKK